MIKDLGMSSMFRVQNCTDTCSSHCPKCGGAPSQASQAFHSGLWPHHPRQGQLNTSDREKCGTAHLCISLQKPSNVPTLFPQMWTIYAYFFRIQILFPHCSPKCEPQIVRPIIRNLVPLSRIIVEYPEIFHDTKRRQKEMFKNISVLFILPMGECFCSPQDSGEKMKKFHYILYLLTTRFSRKDEEVPL